MDIEKVPLTIYASGALSCVAFWVTFRVIPRLKDMFIKANMYGIDMSKTSKEKM